MFLEKKGARRRGMPHTHRSCDSAYCRADQSHQYDVCRLKQTCTPKGAAEKYLTTITDVMILNNTVSLDVARVGPNPIPRACSLVNCPLTVLLYNYSPSRPNSCPTWVNSFAETFQIRFQGSQMMLWRNKFFHHKRLASQIPPMTVTFGALQGSEKVTTRWDWFE